MRGFLKQPRKLELSISKLEIPLWKWDIYFYRGDNYKVAYNQVFGFETDFNDTVGTGAVTFSEPHQRCSLIWLPNKSPKNQRIQFLAHEAAHVAFAIGHRSGLQLSSESEEAFTYLLEHILDFLLRACQEKGKRAILKKN